MRVPAVFLLGWQAAAAGQSFSVVELILPLSGLIVLLIVAIVVARRWSRTNQDASISASAMLTEFRDLKDQGKLSADEYKRIKETLGGRFRAETGTGEGSAQDAATDSAHADGGTREMAKLTTPDIPVIPRPPAREGALGEASDSA